MPAGFKVVYIRRTIVSRILNFREFKSRFKRVFLTRHFRLGGFKP